MGDPRNGKIDMVDWIEMIPFRETRNYVQRIMEERRRLSRPQLNAPAVHDGAAGGVDGRGFFSDVPSPRQGGKAAGTSA